MKLIDPIATNFKCNAYIWYDLKKNEIITDTIRVQF